MALSAAIVNSPSSPESGGPAAQPGPRQQPEREHRQAHESGDGHQHARHRPDTQGTPEADTQIVASAPQLAEEQVRQRPRIAVVDAVHARLADHTVAGVAYRLAELDVLAGFQALVEAADLLERGSADGEVTRPKPFDVAAIGGLDAQRVVHPLHPRGVHRRVVGVSCDPQPVLQERACARMQPIRPNLVVRVDERQDVAARDRRARIPAGANPEAGSVDDAGLRRVARSPPESSDEPLSTTTISTPTAGWRLAAMLDRQRGRSAAPLRTGITKLTRAISSSLAHFPTVQSGLVPAGSTLNH